MQIIVTPHYYWLFRCILFVVPSGKVIINGRWWDACRFVWWWPVNWVVYPIAFLTRLYFKAREKVSAA